MEFEQYILTRFNTPFLADPSRCLKPSFIEGRLGYFRRFCLQAMKAQTVQDFRWIVWMHKRTPGRFVEQMKSLLNQDNFQLALTDEYGAEYIQRFMRQQRISMPWLVTSRIDSDDAVAVDYVEVIQEIIRTKREFINYSEGFEWQQGRIQPYHCSHIGFQSYVEPIEECRTVYQVPHYETAKVGLVRQYSEKPMWIWVTSHENLCERSGRDVTRWASDDTLPDRFVIGEEYETEGH